MGTPYYGLTEDGGTHLTKGLGRYRLEETIEHDNQEALTGRLVGELGATIEQDNHEK